MPAKPSRRHRFARSFTFEYLEARTYLDGHGVLDDSACLLDAGEGEVARAAHAINCFAIDLYEQFQEEDGNLFLSPTSIATALTMAYAGAAGQTAEEMESVLHLGAEPGIHPSFGALISSFEQSNGVEGFELELANAMWPRDGLPIRDEFIQTIQTVYAGEARSLDYSQPDQAKETINNWVEDKTHGKVQDLIDRVSPMTAIILTNSIYFKAFWEYPFDPTFTDPAGGFHLQNGETVETTMMNTQVTVPYTEMAGFQVMEMPFEGGDTSMVFVLPMQPQGPIELTPKVLAGIDNWLETPREPFIIDLMMPKFETTVSSKLRNVLVDMGMPSAFGNADFSNLVEGGGIWIDQVQHKAFLEVNEQGTEAAAATSVDFFLCFAAGTPVLTPDGAKPIEQLKAGDVVLSRHERNVGGRIEKKLVEDTFQGHAELFNLRVGGQTIRVTDAHPFFVKDQGWTPACKLQSGDLLATDLSSWMEVENVIASGESEPVYNIRVAELHTYFVGGEEWGFAVWAHNDYGPSFNADHPFHFLIRDNTSSSLLFMGRLSDPTQSENDIAFAPVAGDSNGDGRFTSSDLVLVFQAGKYDDGIDGNANFFEGDWNDDGDFDSRDLVFAFQNSVYEGAMAAHLPLQQIAATLFEFDNDDERVVIEDSDAYALDAVFTDRGGGDTNGIGEAI